MTGPNGPVSLFWLRGDGRVGRQEAERLSPSRKVVSDMADSIDPRVDEEHGDTKKRFGTGRSFEEVLNEVHRHTSCLARDWDRIQGYLEAVSRKRDNRA
jgi:hypothetical protein